MDVQICLIVRTYLIVMIVILLARLIVGQPGRWGAKCQSIGMWIVMRLPVNQGDTQAGPR